MSKSLSREIGVFQLVTYYFSTVVGAGIFVVPLTAAKIAGPASIISWLLALLIAIPFAFIFAHISARYKVSGSIQKFLEDSGGIKFGRAMALYLVIAACIGNSLLGFTSAGYILKLFDIPESKSIFIIGVGMLTLSCFFNLMNIGVSSRIQSVSIIVLIVFVELIVCTSIPSYSMENLQPFMPNGLDSVFAATVICFYSITGWENVDGMAEEVKDPYRTYKSAIKIAIGMIGLFYLSIVITTVAALSPSDLSGSSAILSVLLSKVIGVTSGKIGAVMAIAILILGSNAWVFGTSRWIYALSRDGVLPKSLSKLSPTSNVPSTAILAQLIVYIIIAISLTSGGLNQEFVVELAALCYLSLYTVIFFCGMKKLHTKKLKLLSGASMLTTLFFLYHTTSQTLSVAIICMALAFSYIYLFKKA